MKLSEITESTNTSGEGVYFAGKLSEESKDKLTNFAEKEGITNIVPRDKMHITMVSHEEPLNKNIEVDNTYYTPIKINPTKLISLGEGKHVGVEFTSDDFDKRRDEILKKYKLTHNYADFIPHVTLSYNDDYSDNMTGDVDDIGTLDQVGEYSEPYSPTWSAEYIDNGGADSMADIATDGGADGGE